MHCKACIRHFVTDRATLGNKDIKSIFAALKRLLMLTFALKDLFDTETILQHQKVELLKACTIGMHSQIVSLVSTGSRVRACHARKGTAASYICKVDEGLSNISMIAA